MDTEMYDDKPLFIQKNSDKVLNKIRTKRKFKRLKIKFFSRRHGHDYNYGLRRTLKDKSLKKFKLPTRKGFTINIEQIERRYKKIKTRNGNIIDYDFYEKDLLRRFKKSKFTSAILQEIKKEKEYHFSRSNRYIYHRDDDHISYYDVTYNIPKKPKKMKEKCFKRHFRKRK